MLVRVSLLGDEGELFQARTKRLSKLGTTVVLVRVSLLGDEGVLFQARTKS